MASYDNVIEKSILSTENRSIEKIFEKSIHYFFVDMLKSFNDTSKVMNKESIRLVNIFDRVILNFVHQSRASETFFPFEFCMLEDKNMLPINFLSKVRRKFEWIYKYAISSNDQQRSE